MYVDRLPPLQPSRCCCRRNDMQHDRLCIFVSARIRPPYAGLFCIPLHGSRAEHASPDWQYVRSSLCSQEPRRCQDTISIQLSHRMLTAGSNTNMLLQRDHWEEEEEEDIVSQTQTLSDLSLGWGHRCIAMKKSIHLFVSQCTKLMDCVD